MLPVRAAVEVPARPVLTTVPNVEILEVGEDWHTSTGDFTFTAEDLQAAVDAQADPAIHSPILKFGHDGTTGPPGPKEPAIGRLANLRVENNGQTLVADLVGVPMWIAEIMASAFPERSIEGAYEVKTATGNQHKFVIDALSLLGIWHGAIETLEDIAEVYGVALSAASGVGDDDDHHVVLAARATLPTVPPIRVQAATSTEDVRRAYYESLESGQMWWWIREVQLDPAALIVDDDEGHLWRVDYDVSGDEVTFGEPEEVRIEYVAATSSPAPGPRAATVIFASRAESRPEVEPMDLSALRESLGMPDATDEEVVAAAAERLTVEPTPVTPPVVDTPAPVAPAPVADTPGPVTVPDGAVLVDASTWAEVQARANDGAQAASVLRRRDRDAFIDRVRASGRLAPANADLRASLEREWDRDPTAAQRVASQLAVVVPLEEIGTDAGAEAEASVEAYDAMDAFLFPEVVPVRAAQNGASGG